jgi:hypothetical protein
LLAIPSSDPDERHYRIQFPPWVRMPRRTRGQGWQTHASGATGRGSRHSTPRQMIALLRRRNTATDTPGLCGRGTAPGHPWAPPKCQSDPAGPSANKPPVPRWACAGVAAVRLSTPAAWLATSVASVNNPVCVFAQLSVQPRELKVSGLPSPRFSPILLCIPAELDDARFCRQAVPIQTSRTARAVSPGTALLRDDARKPSTKSSAKRTMWPYACFCVHRWTQRTNM